MRVKAGQSKKISEFQKNLARKSGYTNTCKVCRNEKMRERYHSYEGEDREKMLKRNGENSKRYQEKMQKEYPCK